LLSANVVGRCPQPTGTALALKNDGTVFAWGLNLRGQANVPAGLNGLIAIAADGYQYSVALKSNGTFVSASDRNLKENFERLDSRAVLEKVTGLPGFDLELQKPIPPHDTSARWPRIFTRRSGVGPDDKHITTVTKAAWPSRPFRASTRNWKRKTLRSEKLKDQKDLLEQRLNKMESRSQTAHQRKMTWMIEPGQTCQSEPRLSILPPRSAACLAQQARHS